LGLYFIWDSICWADWESNFVDIWEGWGEEVLGVEDAERRYRWPE
jgi:hypothetical protein